MGKLFCLFFALFYSGIIHSQSFTRQFAIGTSYRYINRAVFQAGLEYRFRDSQFTVGASALYVFFKEKDKVLPETHFYYVNPNIFPINMFGASFTPYSVEPRIGISLLNLLNLNTGYAIPTVKSRYFKGITFGIQINFGENHFYDELKIM